MSYYLFYSSYSKPCAEIIRILDKSSVSLFTQKFSVDIDPRTKKRPDFVRSYSLERVPCVLVNGELFEGRACFEWLRTEIEKREEGGSGISTQDNKQPINKNALYKDRSNRMIGYSELDDDNMGVDLVQGRQMHIDINSDEDPPHEGFDFRLPDTDVGIQARPEFYNNKKTPSSIGELPSIKITKKDSLKKKQSETTLARMMKERGMEGKI